MSASKAISPRIEKKTFRSVAGGTEDNETANKVDVGMVRKAGTDAVMMFF